MKLGIKALVAVDDGTITIGVVVAKTTRVKKGGGEEERFTVVVLKPGGGEEELHLAEDEFCPIERWNSTDRDDFVSKNIGHGWADSKIKEFEEEDEPAPRSVAVESMETGRIPTSKEGDF